MEHDLGPLPPDPHRDLEYRTALLAIENAVFDLKQKHGLTACEYLSVISELLRRETMFCLGSERDRARQGDNPMTLWQAVARSAATGQRFRRASWDPLHWCVVDDAGEVIDECDNIYEPDPRFDLPARNWEMIELGHYPK